LSSGALAGIVVGGIMGTALSICILVLYLRWRRTRDNLQARPTNIHDDGRMAAPEMEPVNEQLPHVEDKNEDAVSVVGGRLQYPSDDVTDGGRLGSNIL